MTFHEEWFSAASQQAIARLARGTAGVPGDVVEIGSWEGRSTVALANAIYPDVVHAVDTWAGSPGEISAELAEERDIHSAFLANIEGLTRGNVVPHRMGWREWFAEPRQLRMVFIDAEHTYNEVYDNIRAALPYLSVGGVICGDDVHHPPIQQAVLDTIGPFNVTASLWWKRIGVT